MIINWYGEGCFKVQTGGLTLLTDPLGANVGLTPARGKSEIILKTLIPWPLEEKAEKEGGQLICGAGNYEIKGVHISGFSLPQESSDKFIKTAYQVMAEDITLGFLGHISDNLPPEAMEALIDSHILFMPAGGKPFINQEKAAKLIKQLNPKIVVATFFKTPGLKRQTSDWKDLADEMDQKPEIMDKLTIRKKEMAEQKGIRLIVLTI